MTGRTWPEPTRGVRPDGWRVSEWPVGRGVSRALAEYLLPSMCAGVGEIERRSIVIERVTSAYQTNNPRRDARRADATISVALGVGAAAFVELVSPFMVGFGWFAFQQTLAGARSLAAR